jgi:hypothetical protein
MTAMLRPTRLLAALLLAGLAACNGEKPVLTPASLPTPGAHPDTAITVNREQGGRFLSFVGPKTQHDPLFLGVAGTNYDTLRTLLDTRSGETVHQLFVEDSYAGTKREWFEAEDEKGQKLRFIPIGSDEITCDGGCSYAEEFAAALPDPLLRASTNGLIVTFIAKSGARTVIQIPGPQVAAQLAAVDNAKKSLAAQAAPAPTPVSAPVPK